MSKFKLTQTAAEVQGILNNFNSLKSDAEGNLTASKNLGVDGKLTLKSLVSASNPDGDITKELGGGGGGSSGSARHCYFVDVDRQFIYMVYTEKNYNFTIGTDMVVQDFMTNQNYAELHAGDHFYPASGTYIGNDNIKRVVRYISLYSNNHLGYVVGTSLDSNTATDAASIDLSTITKPFTIVQLY